MNTKTDFILSNSMNEDLKFLSDLINIFNKKYEKKIFLKKAGKNERN